jgi:hypothetical protein
MIYWFETENIKRKEDTELYLFGPKVAGDLNSIKKNPKTNTKIIHIVTLFFEGDCHSFIEHLYTKQLDVL